MRCAADRRASTFVRFRYPPEAPAGEGSAVPPGFSNVRSVRGSGAAGVRTADVTGPGGGVALQGAGGPRRRRCRPGSLPTDATNTPPLADWTPNLRPGDLFPASAGPVPGSTEGGGAGAMPSSGSAEAPPDSGAESPDVRAAPTARRRFSGQEAFSKVASAEILRIVTTGPEAVKDFEAFSRRIGCDLPESTEDGGRFYHRPGKAWSCSAPRRPGLPSRNPCETTLEGFARGRPVFDPATRPRGGAARPAGAGG